MNTLSNGSLHGEEAISPCVGIAPGSIPEARSSQTGASVSYAPSPDSDEKWFLFRASYGRERLAADLLIEAGVYAYVPQHYEIVERDGRRKKLLRSLLPNLVFAYLSARDAELFVKGPSPFELSAGRKSEAVLASAFTLSDFLSYYYNHFEVVQGDKNPPLVIAPREMLNFIRATSTHSHHLKQVDMDKCRFLDNKLVEVIQGNYKGVRGRIARVAGQQCLVVSLANGRWNISTDYIPTPFFRVL